MLRFSDFSHLPEADELLQQLIGEPAGLILVAGLDSKPAGAEAAEPGGIPQFLPSGRATIFRVLISELLDTHPRARCRVVAEDKDLLHVARRFRQRIEVVQVKPPLTYAEAIEAVGDRRPGVLVVDRITADNLTVILTVARGGTRVLAQLDTVFHAQAVARYLCDLGATMEELAGLRWVLSVQRLPALCPICKRPADISLDQMAQLESLGRRYPGLAASSDPASRHAPVEGGAFYASGGCPACKFTGRQGDVAAFDFLRIEQADALWTQPSALPMEAYIWMLAQRGQLALTDALQFDNHQLRRTYALLMNSQRQLAETTTALDRKAAELDTANRLLNQRTRELVSLEGIGQALITWNDLRELGARVLKTAMELSKADRGVLYYLRSAEWGQILASRGWQEAPDELGLARGLIYSELSDRQPMPYLGPPPGVELPADSPPSRAGQAMPLVAHGIPAGLMLIQSTRKTQFAPGEVAILQTLAGYAAVAMQRAGLIEQLQIKINALEEAQDELAQKERLERELELARQVQLSMLPRTFPDAPGLAFAAAYAPARQVGGDFYDVIRLDDGRVALVIADVADKGMAAALYMALARSLILAEARQHSSPVTVLHNVNHLLLELGEQDMFVTVFYGVIDRARGRLIYARAGHDHPLLIRDGRLEPLDGRGMVLGLFEAGLLGITEETLDIRSGDRLVLYTDGLMDVVGPDDQMLGFSRLAELVQDRASLPPEEMTRALFDDLAAYRGDVAQFDDMAVVVVGVE